MMANSSNYCVCTSLHMLLAQSCFCIHTCGQVKNLTATFLTLISGHNVRRDTHTMLPSLLRARRRRGAKWVLERDFDVLAIHYLS
jgi:hypothetical protein